jgi:hypothetical protein
MLFASALHRSLEGYMMSMGNQVNKVIIDRLLRELENAQETVVSSYGLPIMESPTLPITTILPRSDRAQLFISAPDPAEPFAAAHIYLTFYAPELSESLGCSGDDSLIILEFVNALADVGNHQFGPDAEWGVSPWLVVLGQSIVSPEFGLITLDPDSVFESEDQTPNMRQLFDPDVAGVFRFLPEGDESDRDSLDQDIQLGIQRVIHGSLLAACHNLCWTSYKNEADSPESYPGRYCLENGFDIFAGRIVCEEAPFSATDGEGAFDMMLSFAPELLPFNREELH